VLATFHHSVATTTGSPRAAGLATALLALCPVWLQLSHRGPWYLLPVGVFLLAFGHLRAFRRDREALDLLVATLAAAVLGQMQVGPPLMVAIALLGALLWRHARTPEGQGAMALTIGVHALAGAVLAAYLVPVVAVVVARPPAASGGFEAPLGLLAGPQVSGVVYPLLFALGLATLVAHRAARTLVAVGVSLLALEPSRWCERRPRGLRRGHRPARAAALPAGGRGRGLARPGTPALRLRRSAVFAFVLLLALHFDWMAHRVLWTP